MRTMWAGAVVVVLATAWACAGQTRLTWEPGNAPSSLFEVTHTRNTDTMPPCQVFELTDTIEQRVQAGTQGADKLTQAVLAKAFRGELVPTEAELARREGRSYEPAPALLERIRRKREAAPKVGRRIKQELRRRRTPKQSTG